MAQEATITVTLTHAKSGVNLPTLTLTKSGLLVDTSGDNRLLNVQTVGTSAEALVLGDVATPGYCILHNCDATNYIEVLDSTGGAVTLKFKAGEWGLFRFGAAAPALKANTASCKVEYLLLPD